MTDARERFEHEMLYQCNYARDIKGEYIDVYTAAYWRVWQKAWQASRKAIVLPDPPHGDSYVTLQQVKQAIGVEP